ncbi:hypothetical protein KIL84_002284 [Mauremys mutica]|uniref:Uncharacterized protein n=1 Tax=Mauremys mutica TaxID=74926 RepID=A0A9D3X7W7_9SAUR|nr:hypothetical protein KIL84_002284 [Mauremys mutica]
MPGQPEPGTEISRAPMPYLKETKPPHALPHLLPQETCDGFVRSGTQSPGAEAQKESSGEISTKQLPSYLTASNSAHFTDQAPGSEPDGLFPPPSLNVCRCPSDGPKCRPVSPPYPQRRVGDCGAIEGELRRL